jgi:hypothetical protein
VIQLRQNLHLIYQPLLLIPRNLRLLDRFYRPLHPGSLVNRHAHLAEGAFSDHLVRHGVFFRDFSVLLPDEVPLIYDQILELADFPGGGDEFARYGALFEELLLLLQGELRLAT